MVWLEMTNQRPETNLLPNEWINKWKSESPNEMPTTWEDLITLPRNTPKK
ncbi:hypothetical protein [Anaerobacillus alkalilacustris]|nr:hypothetical protein [Anaerobacillus alkalilacustris]